MLGRWILAAILLLLAGCTRTPPAPPAPPAPPKPADDPLVGLTIEEVKVRLGPPDSESQQDRPFDFGPHPDGLEPGDPYTYLYYADQQGQQLHVFCVGPAIFERVKGRSPGTAAACVLAVFRYQQGTVF